MSKWFEEIKKKNPDVVWTTKFDSITHIRQFEQMDCGPVWLTRFESISIDESSPRDDHSI